MSFKVEEKLDVEAVKKALGEPFLFEFTEYVRKVRNNLMFLGILSILVVYKNINISNDSSLFGLKLQGWNMHLIYVILFSLVTYFLVHFIWLAWDYFLEWRLRLTGTHGVNKYNTVPNEMDIANDLRQTTLYSWWVQNTNYLKPTKEIIASIEKSFYDINHDNNPRTAQEQYSNIIAHLSAINQNLNILTAAVERERIPASLEKFDNTFFHFQKSQGWRWAIIELYIPVWIAVFALSWLSTVIWL